MMDITYIIPTRIESEDRRLNAIKSLSYLCKYSPHNIIILESDSESKIPSILESIDTNGAKIEYIFIQNSDKLFHKTKFLNMMLKKVTTSVVSNYDIDVLLHPTAYTECYKLIKEENYDLVYPYLAGDYLIDIKCTSREKITYDINILNSEDFFVKICNHGLCQFLKTDSYVKAGGMNEKFLSYGPEDWELGYRFKTFGYKITWTRNFIFHLDHSRGLNSGVDHEMAQSNYDLYEAIQKMSKEQLRAYYNV